MKRMICLGLLLFGTLCNAEVIEKEDLPIRLPIKIDNQDQILLIDKASKKPLNAPALNRVSRYVVAGETWLASAKSADGKLGYVNDKGEWLTTATLDEARAFSEGGIARVKVKDKWGFLQSDGTFFVEAKYHDVTPFQNGFAAVQEEEGDDYYYIDRSGSKVFDQTFFGAGRFADNGLAAVAVGSVIPTYVVSLKQVEKLEKGTKGEQRWGYINNKGEMVIKPEYSRADTFNDFNIASVRDSSNNSILIDDKGKRISDTTYDYLWAYSPSGVAWSKAEGGDQFEGYIDTKGKQVWEASYQDFGGEQNGLLVKQRGGYQVFDYSGKLVIKEKSTWAGNFQDEQVTIALRDQWGILSREGKFSAFPDDIISPLTSSNNYVMGFQDGLISMLNKDREVVYFNTKGELEYKLGANKEQLLTLFNKDNAAIWKSKVKSQKIPSFLAADAFEHFQDISDHGEGVLKTIEQLLAAEPKKYFIPNPLYRTADDPYDLSGDIDELKKGAIKIVASVYVDESEWGTYGFLSTHESDAFDDYEAILRSIITKKYGAPFESSSSTEKWKIDGKVLSLASFSDFGDGDFYHQLILQVGNGE